MDIVAKASEFAATKHEKQRRNTQTSPTSSTWPQWSAL